MTVDLKSLTQECGKVRGAALMGALNVWQMLALVSQILRFIQQFDPTPAPEGTDGPGHITFGASPLDVMEFTAMVDEVCVALGAPPADPEAMEGIADRLAEQALAKLLEAVKAWMAGQGYATIWDLLAALLNQLTPPAQAAE